ncbi:acetyl-CoA carboxylase biotin carboxylase subunit [Mesorhizobium sp. WSM4887]|uniref:acetyl-CoA carboxylase biotin carboxylase subunit n=1 Tax=Mesorhizobium sp. WSM4887 TaxID=3038543 RepID=UPI0024164E19|nr:acetyl-CoA carboxylase biotin carboxylase subunit [Mesorhizobium sp. WSM4887]MDG4889795.1 acetyl-CoA carboxylase biotin carboxylase subunit [Mesorhizobium sp. WSM4887]
MFRKILIANRGEISCRIMRTAKRLGIGTVAIYSDADRDAAHVQMADEAYRVGPPPAAQSYLDIGRIVEICRGAGVDAVHPGYGFLSERRAFAEALRDAGVGFIGPNPEAIDAMGDKITSKRVAAAAGVSVVPGYLGTIASAEEAVRIADEIGYPVMVKASAGGGGKGMRIAHSAGEVAESVERSRSEAAASFGDDRLFIEKYIVEPRHIEIQVLGDKHGNVIHLGERECSVQRRNQKVLEESPSLFVNAEMREAMGSQAVALARAVGYDSAGTVEFVVGQDRSFYFLEMNTRLQVEHPVTEFVTGLDLVEEMIRVASGEPLRHRQEDIRLTGWAVESRICAESPERGFLPSAGRLDVYQAPKEERGRLRIDDGVREGDNIPALYDPLIAKLVTYADTRNEAIDLQASALDHFAIEGVATNIDFLSDLHLNQKWRRGEQSTALIADEYGACFEQSSCGGDELRYRAAVAATAHVAAFYGQGGANGRLANPIRLSLLYGDSRIDVAVLPENDSAVVELEGRRLSVATDWHPGEPFWRGSIDGSDEHFKISATGTLFEVVRRGVRTSLQVLTPRQADLIDRLNRTDNAPPTGELLSPMLGVLVRWVVAEGDRFAAGEPLCVLEAMKMEMVLRAERDGVVSQLAVAPGTSIQADTVLMRFA